MIGSAGIKCDATNPFYDYNMQVLREEQKAMKNQESGVRSQEVGDKSDAVERVPTNTAASLAIADEILLRIAPESAGLASARVLVLQVIERDKADVLALLRELGEALDSNAELNTYTGEFWTLVNPDWFGKLRRALERHTGVRVMDRLQLP